MDLTLANVRAEWRDPFLRRAWLESCAGKYMTGDRTDLEVSPLSGDLAGLPPMFVHGASDEIILPDVERLVERARNAGVASNIGGWSACGTWRTCSRGR